MIVWSLFWLITLVEAETLYKTLSKNYFDSEGYPSTTEWQEFNSSVRGNLIEFRHPGAVCYGSSFDYRKCSEYGTQSSNASYIRDDPFMTNFPFWAGDPCPLPQSYMFGGYAASCNQGKYPDYAVAVESAEDVSKTLKFAAKHNIRVIIKNTGHDFLGRNVGVGAISIWTRNLKGIEWIPDWNNNRTSLGVQPAVRYGSGHTWSEVSWAVRRKNHIVVSGAEGSVGAGGGWIQGGGHGPFSVVYGLGVENVLEYEVVTPTGEIVKANSESNPDLFWALRGGGATTFGVLTRVTYKAHPRPLIVPVSLTFYPTVTSAGKDVDSYYKALAWYYSIAPTFNDFGIGGYPVASKYGFTGPFVIANRTKPEVQAFLDPIVGHMKDEWNVSFSYILYPESIVDDILWPADAPTALQEPAGRFWVPMVSRILSRSAMTSSKLPALYKFVKTTLDDDATHMAYPNIPGKSKHSRAWNFSLNPAWKTASQHLIVTHWSWNSMQDIRNLYDRMTRKYIPLLEEFSDGHAAYINEANVFERDWKKTFYGSDDNYARLLSIKKKYDPNNILWCSTCVGGDVFIEGPDGRLYRG